MLKSSAMRVSTPELLWHGGGNENGKPDPVFSVDLHPSNVLATAGIDANVPPKGSVRVSENACVATKETVNSQDAYHHHYYFFVCLFIDNFNFCLVCLVFFLFCKLWLVDSKEEGQEFIVDLSDHQSSVNVVRFSPCGRMLASASDKQIVVYTGE